MGYIVIAIIGINDPDWCFLREVKELTEHIVPEQWLRYGFWKESEQHGQWFHLQRPARALSAEEAAEEILHHLGAIYTFDGSIDEFFRKFSRIPVDGNVKRCPVCRECFVSPPTEFMKHVARCSCAREAREAKASQRQPISDEWHDNCCACC